VRLPRRSREVLVLRFYLDMTDQEIAAVGGHEGDGVVLVVSGPCRAGP
jgi:Sigma-70, region 4